MGETSPLDPQTQAISISLSCPFHMWYMSPGLPVYVLSQSCLSSIALAKFPVGNPCLHSSPIPSRPSRSGSFPICACPQPTADTALHLFSYLAIYYMCLLFYAKGFVFLIGYGAPWSLISGISGRPLRIAMMGTGCLPYPPSYFSPFLSTCPFLSWWNQVKQAFLTCLTSQTRRQKTARFDPS